MGFRRVGFRAFEQPQEVLGLAQVGADGGQVKPLADAVVVRGHDRQLGNEGKTDFLHLAGVLGAVVIHAQHGDSRAQRAHGAGGLCGSLEEIENRLRQFAVVAQALFQPGKLLAVRQPLIQEQVDDFCEAAKVYQVFNLVSAVKQVTLLAAHIAQTGLSGDNAFEPLGIDDIFLGLLLVLVHAESWENGVGRLLGRLPGARGNCFSGGQGISSWRTRHPAARRSS